MTESKKKTVFFFDASLYRVEGTEVAASKEGTDEALDKVFEEALEEFKLEEVGTEMTSLGEVLEENLDEVKVVEVGTEMVVLVGGGGRDYYCPG